MKFFRMVFSKENIHSTTLALGVLILYSIMVHVDINYRYVGRLKTTWFN
ncbi:hypothetical protein [Shouchella patagoniensis]|nr:hypothetical protein [Shouchella patagoniensis]